MDKITGKLFYNFEKDRIGVEFDNGEIEDGLHCGQTMEINIMGKWFPTRIEYNGDWFLVGISLDNITEAIVRL